ncbi:MAG: hypothetical protein AB1405_00110 [Bdellovibrionota bacterium]
MTAEVLGKKIGKELSYKEAREAARVLGEFFEILIIQDSWNAKAPVSTESENQILLDNQ